MMTLPVSRKFEPSENSEKLTNSFISVDAKVGTELTPEGHRLFLLEIANFFFFFLPFWEEN